MVIRIIQKYGKKICDIPFVFGVILVFFLFQIDANMPLFFEDEKWHILKATTDLRSIIISCIFFGMYMGMSSMVASIAFGLEFLEEWKSGVASHIIKNMGLKKYAFVYSVLTTLSGGTMLLIGYLLYVWYMSVHIELFNIDAVNTDMQSIIYAYTLEDSRGLQFIIIMAMLMFLFGAISALIALCISTLTENKYIVIFSPYLFYRGYIEISKIICLEDKYRLDYYITGRQNIGRNFIEFNFIILFLLIILIIIGQYIFGKGVRRRLINGKY